MDFSQPDERAERADRRILGWAVVFGVGVVLGVAAWNPLHVELGLFFPVYAGVAALAGTVALVWVACWTFRRPVARGLVMAAGALLTAYAASSGAVLVLFAMDFFMPEEVLAARGSLQLVHVRYVGWIDPQDRVELRRAFGPVRQTVVVWNGAPEGDEAGAARFTGPHEVEVTVPRYDGTICRYRSGFDPLTLEPDQRHDDWERSGDC